MQLSSLISYVPDNENKSTEELLHDLVSKYKDGDVLYIRFYSRNMQSSVYFKYKDGEFKSITFEDIKEISKHE